MKSEAIWCRLKYSALLKRWNIDDLIESCKSSLSFILLTVWYYFCRSNPYSPIYHLQKELLFEGKVKNPLLYAAVYLTVCFSQWLLSPSLEVERLIQDSRDSSRNCILLIYVTWSDKLRMASIVVYTSSLKFSKFEWLRLGQLTYNMYIINIFEKYISYILLYRNEDEWFSEFFHNSLHREHVLMDATRGTPLAARVSTFPTRLQVTKVCKVLVHGSTNVKAQYSAAM